ncbi:hypothetical protein GDO81_004402 [Engystomops pustulosus]|uniref:Uncharacterized protein n=1 Tax=Engystomops pustulosus TaxID=76066 RepID=A0AAV6ZSP8_ENGPU|nr:hypothetical protein GDO81_004402 [Engystomops pustulosus]KAG8552072.1 hypothetical protein GDO81_004402 [Engystomops pustulosus]
MIFLPYDFCKSYTILHKKFYTIRKVCKCHIHLFMFLVTVLDSNCCPWTWSSLFKPSSKIPWIGSCDRIGRSEKMYTQNYGDKLLYSSDFLKQKDHKQKDLHTIFFYRTPNQIF